jgi:hypothetical protein
MRYLSAAVLAALATVCVTAPARAAVVVCNGANCLNTDENVLLTSATNVSTATGVTNNSGVGVTFTSQEMLGINVDANGQASISAVDGRLGSLSFVLDAGSSFARAIFNLSPVPGNQANEATLVTFSYLNADGTAGSQTTGLTNLGLSTNGNNFFGISGNAGERFTGISFNTNNSGSAGIDAFQQLRLGGVTSAVPEPTTWAMMLIGFGAVGFAMRKRPSRRLQMA